MLTRNARLVPSLSIANANSRRLISAGADTSWFNRIAVARVPRRQVTCTFEYLREHASDSIAQMQRDENRCGKSPGMCSTTRWSGPTPPAEAPMTTSKFARGSSLCTKRDAAARRLNPYA